MSIRLITGIFMFILLFAFFPVVECTEQNLVKTNQSIFETELSTLMNASRYEHASLGIIVVDPETGKTLYERNPDQLFIPASTTKIFSSAAVLHALGPDYRFVTPVYAMAAPGTDGSVDGNLVLVASGDPSMGGRTLPDNTIEFTDIDHGDANSLQEAILTSTDPLAGLVELASKVKASGISKVSDVIIDNRLFEINSPLGIEKVSPIMINDNLVDLTITPGTVGIPPSLSMRPQTETYHIVNNVTTGPAGTALEIMTNEYPAGTIVVSGTVAADAGQVNQTFSVQDPASFARTLFIEALEREGVTVTAEATGENPEDNLPEPGNYAGAMKVATLTSPPLSEDTKLTLKVSQNLHANHYIMLLAMVSNKTTFLDGMKEEERTLKSLGFDTSSVIMSDGAGGDNSNRVSPRAVVQLLILMAKQPYAEKFLQAQPVLGVDGSLATSCISSNPACGKVYAKTGTMMGYDILNSRLILPAKTLAGYIDAKSGKRLVFSVYANNIEISDLRDMMTVGEDIGSIAGMIYNNY